MRDPKQKMRYTFAELGLLKSLFAADDTLLFIIRKVMFQFPLNEQEKSQLKAAMTDEVYGVLLKTFLPYIDPDAPILQMAHLNTGLGSDIKSLSPDGAWPFIRAKKLETDYLLQQVKALRDEGAQKIVLADLTTLDYIKTEREDAWVNVMAWNFIMAFIDTNIQQLKFLAGLKHESVEQTLTRLSQDSAK